MWNIIDCDQSLNHYGSGGFLRHVCALKNWNQWTQLTWTDKWFLKCLQIVYNISAYKLMSGFLVSEMLSYDMLHDKHSWAGQQRDRYVHWQVPRIEIIQFIMLDNFTTLLGVLVSLNSSHMQITCSVRVYSYFPIIII